MTNIDREVIKNMRLWNSDIESEREVAFYFYFPEEYQAHHAAAKLINLQFETVVSYSEYGDHWLCLATKSMAVSTERLSDLRNWMVELAKKYDGKYDGWETAIEPGGNE
jgi:regulator of RNase E activity RraB